MLASDFIDEIQGPNRKHFYIIKGTEPVLVSKCIKATEEVLSPEVAELNFHSVYLEDEGAQGILDQASASSFFPEDKIFLVKVQESKKILSEVQEFMSWIEHPAPKSTIVMLYPNIKDTTRLAKAARALDMVVDCPAPAKTSLSGWVERVFTDKGLKISKEAVAVLIERVGDNLQTILSESEKLSLWPGPKTSINPKIIRENVSLNSSSVLYELSSPIAEGNMLKAAPILLDLLDQVSPFAVLSVLSTHFLRLLDVKIHIEDREARGEPVSSTILAQELEYTPYYLDILRKQALNWTFSNLMKAISALEDTYRAYKTINTPQTIIFEELCVKLTQLAKGNDHA